jgi:8-oxo-dGTP diphosphatase
MPTIRKAFAYITHGERLLVFRHPYAPDAGIQVPAGTIRDGEQPEDAVMREAWEETGLPELEMVRFLGERWLHRSDVGLDQIHHRHFYHLRCTTEPPATWRHEETDPSDGSPGPIVFEFFWARLPDEGPELIAGHGAMIPSLVKSLAEIEA